MGAVFDRMEKADDRQEHREGPLSPATETAPPKDTLSATFEKAYDFIQMPKAEQDRLAEERAEIDGLKEFAKTHGISVAEAQALKGTQLAGQPGQLPPEYAKLTESVKQLYPDDKPHEVFEQYAAIDKLVKSDPLSGIAWIAERTSGMNPLQLAQGLAIRFGDQTAIMHDAQSTIDQWMATNPQAAQLEGLMVEALESGAVRRSGHFTNDLEAAFKHAQKSQKTERRNRKQGRHLDRSLREVYDRMNNR
jgi:hypothetical protein